MRREDKGSKHGHAGPPGRELECSLAWGVALENGVYIRTTETKAEDELANFGDYTGHFGSGVDVCLPVYACTAWRPGWKWRPRSCFGCKLAAEDWLALVAVLVFLARIGFVLDCA